MNKLYGYKERDVKGLSDFVNQNAGEPLSKLFERYALATGKAKGTVRNMYYAMAKKARTDEEFKQTVLSGKNFKVNKPESFTDKEYDGLINYILTAKKQGKSVRKATAELAKGDIKLALRYQNKYRNALKKDKRVMAGAASLNSATEKVKAVISDATFTKLKSDINALINRISMKEVKQNEYLKNRVYALEKENARLNKLLYGEEKSPSLLFFDRTKKEDVIN